ncbi:MAG: tetratricopeptide repeat protein [Ignavibacteria bacterium]
MELLTIICLTNKSFLSNKNITYGKDYLLYFKKFFPDNLNPEQIKEGLIYFYSSSKNSNSENLDTNSISIKIKKFKITADYIFLEFDIKETTEYPSTLIKEILRSYLKKNKNISQNEITPFLSIVEKDEFFDFLQREKISSHITVYEKKRDWEKIIQFFEPLDQIEETEFWNNALLLSKLAFALSQSSECSINLKKQFPSIQQRDQFLKQKKYFRTNCEKIFNRLIELDNLNPSYYSSKAYFHYQNLNELIFPGGRRDGNFFEETQKALDNIENALERDFSRINDHYRKGYILTKILPDKITFAPNPENIPDKFKNKKLLIEEGILSFERVLKIYDDQNASEEFKKRHFNTFIKTLYNLASVYKSNVLTKNEKIIKIVSKIFPDSKLELSEEILWFDLKMKNLKKALEYFEKFARWVNKKFIDENEEPDILKVIEMEESLLGNKLYQPRMKAYQLGSIYFEMFLICSENEYFQKAKKSLMLALQLKKNNSAQKDFYIHNLLATIYILEDKAELAIRLLEDIQKKNRLDDYIKITLLISYTIKGEFLQSERILKELLGKQASKYRNELLFWNFIINEKQSKRQHNLITEMGISIYKRNIDSNSNNNDDIDEIYSVNGKENIYSRIALKILNHKK